MHDDDLRARLDQLDLEQKVRLLTGADVWSLHPEPAVGLRRLVVSDGPAGVRGERWDERDTSANVPSPTALAATWDVDRTERLGRLLATEARRRGVDVLLAPTVNLHRTPYGGRHFECFSEDPLLTGRIGVAYVRGLQQEGVGATVKHFVANDQETERFSADIRADERVLRELYLAPFEAIVREGGVWAVMAAYNAVDGTTMTESPLQRDVLKAEWGFDGVVVSDWFAARSLAAAGSGLLDLVMPGPRGPWGDALVAAVRAGAVPESAVDDKVLRVLRLAGRVGALDGAAGRDATPWTAEQIGAELRATAAAGFVLARNEPADAGEGPLLPLDRSRLRRVAVLGPNAVEARTLGGGSATVFPPYTVSPLAGLRAALGPDVEVRHGRGGRSTHRLPPADPDLLRRPDGGRGVAVRFLDAEGAVLGTEQREAAGFTWQSSYGPGLPMDRVRAVEVHTRVRAEEDGTHRIGASGVGPFRVTVGGEVRLDSRISLPPGADPVEGMMRPPQESVPVDLRAGEEVEVVVRHVPEPAGGFEGTDVESVTFQVNVARDADDDAELDRAVALARDADVAVVVVGTTEEVESEGFDRTSLALPGRQDELVRRVVEVNPRTVVVVNSGAPVLLPWADDVPAVLLTWFPGQECGNALADVLLGVSEPGGRLPVTWPADEEGLPSPRPVGGTLRYDEGLFVGHRRHDRDGREPRFRFGSGLGYTTWEYLSAEAGASAVTVRLRNTGGRRGREVVQVYAARPDSAVERPVRWLAGFAVVEAGPAEEVAVTVDLPERTFQHWDEAAHRWATEAGAFRLHVGPSSGVLPLALDVQVPS
ncbi:beta-glucosidase family protein [Geodermatophilus chilensis]|uniref:beta-glucosidase family protein n=1 Tax=Geodermatophilus chilensis TaxID=2035835 RepID=UPI001E2841EC|nr:glycoside hydrolase family 3 C-terminal domain-containing protein [Geodermatophilus chilensis]